MTGGARFSEAFGVSLHGDEEWFDPILSADTPLHVDPFLIYVDRDPTWSAAHAQLISYFEFVLTLIASGKPAQRQAAEELLLFREPAEFCLGVGETPMGHGAGKDAQTKMLLASEKILAAGIGAPSHIEELALMQDGIGPDLLSDIVCNILKHLFIEYTQVICEQIGVETEPVSVANARWSQEHHQWLPETVNLPRNPFTGLGVLLTPKRFLRKIQSVDPADFWDWAWAHDENQALRQAFNYDVGRHVNAKELARLARQNPDLVRAYLAALEDEPKQPYDLKRDRDGIVSWYDAGRRVYFDAAASVPEDPDKFCDYIGELLREFAHHVENVAFDDLWHEGKPRQEVHVQGMLRTFLWLTCKAKDIDMSREPGTGRGPVDFKFSKGFSRRAVTEVKLLSSGKYFQGLDVQTPTYMKAQEIDCGYYVCVGFLDSHFEPKRLKAVTDGAAAVSKREKVKITTIIVDARQKPSASVAKTPPTP